MAAGARRARETAAEIFMVQFRSMSRIERGVIVIPLAFCEASEDDSSWRDPHTLQLVRHASAGSLSSRDSKLLMYS